MPTIIHRLKENKEDWRRLREMHEDRFLHGGCFPFAAALHLGLGWPMVGAENEEGLHHVGVRNPEGKIFDIRGFLSEEEFGKLYSCVPPYKEFSFMELRSCDNRTLTTYSLSQARKVAETLWPEFPWEGTFVGKVAAFVDDVEAVCRKHKLWIRAPRPDPEIAPPLAIGEGDEGGYELRPTIDGCTYTIDRYLVPR